MNTALFTQNYSVGFSFDCQGNECLKNSGRYFKVLVKMDGEIVELKIMPLKDKKEKPQ